MKEKAAAGAVTPPLHGYRRPESACVRVAPPIRPETGSINAACAFIWGISVYVAELDLQLRRGGIQTVVLGGSATNMGVESTARQVWEQGYSLILAEDATRNLSAEMHHFSITNIMPHLAKVVKAVDIWLAG